MKTFFVFLITLLTFFTLLGWQWFQSTSTSSQSSKKEATFRVTTDIVVRNDTLNITQTYPSLVNVSPPPSTKDVRCFLGDEEVACVADDRKAGVDEGLAFQYRYSVPFNGIVKEGMFPLWQETLPDTYSETITIEESSTSPSSWFVNGRQIGGNVLEVIAYYEETLSVPAYTLTRLPVDTFKKLATDDDQLSVWQDVQLGEQPLLARISPLNVDVPIHLIYTNLPESRSFVNTVLVGQDTTEDGLKTLVLEATVKGKMTQPVDGRVVDWVVALMIGDIDNEPVLQSVQKSLDETQWEKWKQSVEKAPLLNRRLLDEFLSAVYGMDTSYFTAQTSEKQIPLFWYDKRPVQFNEEFQNDVDIIWIEDNPYTPFMRMFTALGYEVERFSEEQMILARRGEDTFRFYENQNSFLYNDARYGLLENPLLRIKDELWIGTGWIEEITPYRWQETNESITLE
ncbi:stalk domain-containing protein [Bacillus fonticola]|uniref:stalk domain-containing protein n=1 Tax=Bacillus fonticola TaxID=2728853 RepID=UPI0014758C16|nr:stalk domain-containing protein [Bacillus fonticola]